MAPFNSPGVPERFLRIAPYGWVHFAGPVAERYAGSTVKSFFMPRILTFFGPGTCKDACRSKRQKRDLHLKDVNVTDDPARVGPVDLVLFAVKLWNTETAGEQTCPLLGPDTPVIRRSVTKSFGPVTPSRMVGSNKWPLNLCLERVRNLPAVLRELDHYLLVQHGSRVGHIAGVVQFLCQLFASRQAAIEIK